MTVEPVDLLALAHARPLTVDDLPEDSTGRTELIDGTLYVTPLGDVSHQILATQLAAQLANLVPGGTFALAGVNVYVSANTLIIPDVAVIDPEHLVKGGLGVSPAGLLLAVEITSPSTRRTDLTSKRDLYQDCAVPLIIVDRRQEPHRYVTHGELPSWSFDLLPD